MYIKVGSERNKSCLFCFLFCALKDLTTYLVCFVCVNFLAGPLSGTYLLGGSEEMVRRIADYTTILRKVTQRCQFASDIEKGKLLCVFLLKQEVPLEELASKNVTGMSRDEHHKRCTIPQLNQSLIHCIFQQAKMQYPDFIDWYTDSECRTIKALNKCSKWANHELKKRSILETWGE